MQNGRKIATLIGDSNKRLKEIIEIASQLTARGFLTIIPFPEDNRDSILHAFDAYESQDIQETAIALADLIVMVNLDGITDVMEYIALHNRNKDVVYIVPQEKDDVDNED